QRCLPPAPVAPCDGDPPVQPGTTDVQLQGGIGVLDGTEAAKVALYLAAQGQGNILQHAVIDERAAQVDLQERPEVTYVHPTARRIASAGFIRSSGSVGSVSKPAAPTASRAALVPRATRTEPAPTAAFGIRYWSGSTRPSTRLVPRPHTAFTTKYEREPFVGS